MGVSENVTPLLNSGFGWHAIQSLHKSSKFNIIKMIYVTSVKLGYPEGTRP